MSGVRFQDLLSLDVFKSVVNETHVPGKLQSRRIFQPTAASARLRVL
jgi:hypothetical protein